MYKTDITNSFIESKSFLPGNTHFFDETGENFQPDIQAIDLVVRYYQNTLLHTDFYREDFKNIHIDPECLKKFRIGYGDRTVGFELGGKHDPIGDKNRGQLIRIGLLRHTGHEFFRGYYFFPYPNKHGQIVGGYGRKRLHQSTTDSYHIYWNADKVSFFNQQTLFENKSVILCKSAVDALTLLSVGFENVIAQMGVKGFNEVQLDQLSSAGIDEVYIAFDNTPVINQHAVNVAQQLSVEGISCKRIQLPCCADINTYADIQKDLYAAFSRLIKDAKPFDDDSAHLWNPLVETIKQGIEFYLAACLTQQKSKRTIGNKRNHLTEFRTFCVERGIYYLSDISLLLLQQYQDYLTEQTSQYSTYVLSESTQRERLKETVHLINFLSRENIMDDVLVEHHAGETLH